MTKYNLYVYETKNLRFGPIEVEADNIALATEIAEEQWSLGALGDGRELGSDVDIVEG